MLTKTDDFLGIPTETPCICEWISIGVNCSEMQRLKNLSLPRSSSALKMFSKPDGTKRRHLIKFPHINLLRLALNVCNVLRLLLTGGCVSMVHMNWARAMLELAGYTSPRLARSLAWFWPLRMAGRKLPAVLFPMELGLCNKQTRKHTDLDHQV